MVILLALVLILVFGCVATIHIYWAFGGTKWANLALPTKANTNETLLFKPHAFETLVVALGFFLFIWIVGMKAQLFPLIWFKETQLTYATSGIAIIFLLRAVGEFKYVGFFKKIKDTTFGRMDTQYYTPLCLAIGIITLIISTK